MKRNNPEIAEFVRTRLGRSLDRKCTLTEDEILDAANNDSLLGVVECDLLVPDHLKNNCAEMPPIFKNVEVSLEDISPFMKVFGRRTKHHVQTSA